MKRSEKARWGIIFMGTSLFAVILGCLSSGG